MPTYIYHTLTKYKHPKPTTPQHSPYTFTQVNIFHRIQKPTSHPTSPKLNIIQKTHVKQVIGTLLYYGRAIDPTILVALNTLATMQNSPSQYTLHKLNQLLDYASTHTNATLILFHDK